MKKYLIEKLKALRQLYVSGSLRIRIAIAKKLNPKADHVFWYSKKQDSLPKWPFDSEYKIKGECTFKGKRYSEMKGFEYNGGLSNWDDAKIVGIGSIEDVRWPQ